MILVFNKKTKEKLCTSVRVILRDQYQRPHVAMTLQLQCNDTG